MHTYDLGLQIAALEIYTGRAFVVAETDCRVFLFLGEEHEENVVCACAGPAELAVYIEGMKKAFRLIKEGTVTVTTEGECNAEEDRG